MVDKPLKYSYNTHMKQRKVNEMIDKYTLKGILKLAKITLLALTVSAFVGLCFDYPLLTLIPMAVGMFMLGRQIIIDEAENARTLDGLNAKYSKE